MKATIVSYVPFPITEEKPGIYPGYFHIPPCKDDKIPSLLQIGDSKYHVEIDPDAGRSVTIPLPAVDVARAVVNDYLISNLEYSPENESMPGIFWVEGHPALEALLKEHAEKIAEIKQFQQNWFQRLVTLADDDWERTRQHRAITSMQRHACKALGLDRPWIIQPAKDEAKKDCIACRSRIHPDAIVCPNCKAILNPEAYKAIQFAGVK